MRDISCHTVHVYIIMNMILNIMFIMIYTYKFYQRTCRSSKLNIVKSSVFQVDAVFEKISTTLRYLI